MMFGETDLYPRDEAVHQAFEELANDSRRKGGVIEARKKFLTKLIHEVKDGHAVLGHPKLLAEEYTMRLVFVDLFDTENDARKMHDGTGRRDILDMARTRFLEELSEAVEARIGHGQARNVPIRFRDRPTQSTKRNKRSVPVGVLVDEERARKLTKLGLGMQVTVSEVGSPAIPAAGEASAVQAPQEEEEVEYIVID